MILGRGESGGSIARLAVAAVLWCAACAVTLAPQASAAVADEPALIPPGFSLPASNGYSISGFGLEPRGDKPGGLYLFVKRERSAAFYWTKAAHLAEGEIQADLGDLGFIDLRFRASGRIASDKKCTDNAVAFQAGTYEGTLRFDGEEGFASAAATKVRGHVSPLLRLLCSGSVRGWSSDGLGAGFSVRRRLAQSSVAFAATTKGLRGPSRFVAQIDERRGPLLINRFVEATGGSAAFGYGQTLSWARIAPPIPFSGQARYRRVSPGHHRWLGGLSVDFPGRSGVALAGDAFEARLKGGRSTGRPTL